GHRFAMASTRPSVRLERLSSGPADAGEHELHTAVERCGVDKTGSDLRVPDLVDHGHAGHAGLRALAPSGRCARTASRDGNAALAARTRGARSAAPGDARPRRAAFPPRYPGGGQGAAPFRSTPGNGPARQPHRPSACSIAAVALTADHGSKV